MNLEVRVSGDVAIIKLKESRLVFPQLPSFSSAVKTELERGSRNLILNLSEVNYLDSPAHGCLFELYRFVTERGGSMKVVGLQRRVEAMANLVGLTRVVGVFPSEELALRSEPEKADGD